MVLNLFLVGTYLKAPTTFCIPSKRKPTSGDWVGEGQIKNLVTLTIANIDITQRIFRNLTKCMFRNLLLKADNVWAKLSDVKCR